MEVLNFERRVEPGQFPKLRKRINIFIQRSDGRVHEASVSDIDYDKQCVIVEWVENGETKGKSVDFPFVFQFNQALLASGRDRLDRDAKNGNDHGEEGGSHDDENEYVDESDDDVLMVNVPASNEDELEVVPTNLAQRASIPATSKRPISAKFTRPSLTAAHAGRRQLNLVTETGDDHKSNHKGDHSTSRGTLTQQDPRAVRSTQATNKSSQQSARDRKPEAIKTEISPRASVPGNGLTVANTGNAARMSNCAREIKKLEQNRNQRRIKLEEAKQEKQKLQNADPGNPNWHFLAMIRDYRSSVEFSPLLSTDIASDKQINVCLRKRPLNKKEELKKDIDVVSIPTKDSVIMHECKTKVDLTKYLENQQFRFDYAFDEDATNELVYKFTAQPLIHTIFEGGMATCFAYGQTGSGKTHTMGGNFSGKNQDCSTGIYALATRDIFKYIQKPKYKKENLVVRASFFEIYSGKVFDLLNKKRKLRILEDGDSQVVVCDLQEREVKNTEEVLSLLQAGNAVRTSGQTAANQHSSRSHAVFQIALRTKTGQLHGKFSFIDLAGNERGVDTMSTDRQTRLEGAEINKSLLALKECIRALARRGAHLPFRASKLTQVLRDSFIGHNSRTCMIAMISPGLSCSEHSLNTLRYANRVKELEGNGPGRDEETQMMPTGEDNLADTISSVASDIASLHIEEPGSDGQKQLDLINALREAEDEVLEGQRLVLETFESFGTRFAQIHALTNEVDYDVDEYANQMVHTLNDYDEVFVPLMKEFRRKFETFKGELDKEEEVSKAISATGHHK